MDELRSSTYLSTDPLTDFRNFLWLVWQQLGLPEPTPVQYDIADWLQSDVRRSITMAFRGVGKSFITGAYVCWRLYLNPQLKFLVVSASKDRSDSFSLFVKRLIIEMPLLSHLRPRDDQRFSNVMFDVGPATNDQSPTVKSIGITGQLTGSRADEIIADDVEVPKNSATQEQRAKLGELVKEFDAVLKPGGKIKYLGTPQTEFSLYTELEKRGYTCRIWPARAPDEKRIEFYGKRLSPFIQGLIDAGLAEGRSTDPKRFNDLDLLEREASYGRSGFALQFMLDTTLSDAERYPLRLSDLVTMSLPVTDGPSKVLWCKSTETIVQGLPNVGFNGDRFYGPMDVLKPWLPFKGCVMAVDPSGKGKDETAYAIVKFLHGMLFLVASGGFKDGYGDDTMKGLADAAKRHAVKHIVIEDNFGGGMFAKLFSPWLRKVGYPCTIEDIHSTGQKEARIIDTLEPVLNQHLLILDEEVVRRDYNPDLDLAYSLFFQLTRLTKDRGCLAHDDRVEALAMAVAYWLEQLGLDAHTEMEKAEQALLDKELRGFIDLCTGSRGREERTWCSREG